MKTKLNIHPDVQKALDNNHPVIALESTLITHGFPAPDNLEVARQIEQAVRDEGALPATIAILGGTITVGLTDEQLNYLASAKNVRKCSRRDFAIAVARKEDGATTVAGTMIVAHRAGIPIFATGGIGGVHRGQPFDESADLMEMTRTPVAVVCAGAKAILDLPLTREVLETRGVPMIGYQTDELPAFYSRKSGLPIDQRVDTPAEVATIINAHRQMSIMSGLLVTVPVPADAEWPADEAQIVIDKALADAKAQNIVGKAVTPYLLGRVSDLSDGRSKRANIALLVNNARVAAQIGVALAEG
ncbi:pseudouridine-5'-phosphate glycosidase [Anaerolineales bacterium HSG6]|nr:pseudouridine-5'-phosphate glycosidase [Anaerolineales bacterium HSG6]